MQPRTRTVYKTLPHVASPNPVTVLGGSVFLSDRRRGTWMMRPREVKELRPSATRNPRGGITPLTTGSRVLTAALPLCGFGWVSPAGAVLLGLQPFSSLTPGAIPPGHCPFLPLQAQEDCFSLRKPYLKMSITALSAPVGRESFSQALGTEPAERLSSRNPSGSCVGDWQAPSRKSRLEATSL